MGRQITFFLTPKDLRQLEGVIRQKHGILLLPSRFPMRGPKQLETMEISDMGESPSTRNILSDL
jgi:hypothetical protein